MPPAADAAAASAAVGTAAGPATAGAAAPRPCCASCCSLVTAPAAVMAAPAAAAAAAAGCLPCFCFLAACRHGGRQGGYEHTRRGIQAGREVGKAETDKQAELAGRRTASQWAWRQARIQARLRDSWPCGFMWTCSAGATGSGSGRLAGPEPRCGPWCAKPPPTPTQPPPPPQPAHLLAVLSLLLPRLLRLLRHQRRRHLLCPADGLRSLLLSHLLTTTTSTLLPPPRPPRAPLPSAQTLQLPPDPACLLLQLGPPRRRGALLPAGGEPQGHQVSDDDLEDLPLRLHGAALPPQEPAAAAAGVGWGGVGGGQGTARVACQQRQRHAQLGGGREGCPPAARSLYYYSRGGCKATSPRAAAPSDADG